MYLRQEVVLEALRHVDKVHPFFGITFLVGKQRRLPVGRMASFGFGHAEEQFLLEYYHPNLKSKYFFQPLGTSKDDKRWLSHKYPHSGSQSTRDRKSVV